MTADPARGERGRGDGLVRRLRTMFSGEVGPEIPDPAIEAPDERLHVMAFGEDSIAFGLISLTDRRMSDALNEIDELVIEDARIQDLSDGSSHEVGRLRVPPDELLLVEVVGPRGLVQARRATRGHRLLIHSGPFVVEGVYHHLPGADPVTSFRRREGLVPLTEATVTFDIAGESHRLDASVIAVNRALVERVMEPEIDAVLPLPVVPDRDDGDLPAKDMTDDR